MSSSSKWPMTVFTFLSFLGLASSLSAYAGGSGSFISKCSEIDKCVKAVSELTGDKYIMDAEVKGRVDASDNLELNQANANLLLTKALYLNGFSRVPLSAPNTYQIVRGRDARDTLLPRVTSDSETAPTLPDTWDLVLMVYKVKHPEVAEEMARTARSFMPANSRIIPNELAGQVLITAAAPEVKNVYQIIRDMDQKPSPALLKAWAERKKEWRDHSSSKMMHREEKFIIHKGDGKESENDSESHSMKAK